ncbi:hypothetical protein C2142_17205 [Streptomyces sp. CB01881]|nr:hypothetical protein C2142_17205 [Streptomyces sp. CB01881]
MLAGPTVHHGDHFDVKTFAVEGLVRVPGPPPRRSGERERDMHYVVITRSDSTPDSDLGHYLANVGATMEPYGGRLLAFDVPQRLEGAGGFTKTAVLEFPTGEAARGWYSSAAYQEIAAWRIATMGGQVDINLVSGVPA